MNAFRRTKSNLDEEHSYEIYCKKTSSIVEEALGNQLHAQHALKTKSLLAKMVETGSFESFIMACIMANAVLLGIEVDIDFSSMGKDWERFGYVQEYFFRLVFTLEMFLKLTAFGIRDYFTGNSRGFNVLDLTLVLLSWVELALIDVDVNFTLFRTLRTLRIAKVIKGSPVFRPLYQMITGMWMATQTIMWGMILLAMIIYVCGIYTTGLFKDLSATDHEVDKWWGNIWKSSFSLYVIFTLDGWLEVSKPPMDAYPWTGIFFVMFICLTSLVIMNVVVAIIVDHVIRKALYDETARLQEAKKQFHLATHTMASAFKHIIGDQDETAISGTLSVSKTEFHTGLQDIAIQKLLNNIDIEIHDAEELFEMMDVEKKGKITLHEFVEGCLRLKGQASSKNLMMVQSDLQRQMRRQSEQFTQLFEQQDARLQRLEVAMEAMKEQSQHITKFLQRQDDRFEWLVARGAVSRLAEVNAESESAVVRQQYVC